MDSHDDDLIVGLHAVLAALKTAPDVIDCVWVDRDRVDARIAAVIAAARGGHVGLRRCPRATLDRLVPGLPHQGVAARRRPSARPQEAELMARVAATTMPLLLVLDGIEDPHNLGACLRTAEAAGADAVIVPRHGRAPLSAAACRAASGAAERLPLYEVANLARTLKALKAAGVWLIGAAAGAGQPLHGCAVPLSAAWVLGGEGGGLRRLTRETCDILVHIPMTGPVESLNVSVAAALCLYESVRARRLAAPDEKIALRTPSP
ncbi:MAG: 23S rRNA (guanosine(2251)-2'-O)-methyltransferase RlmB [Acidiferrobacter sp.]